MLITKMKDVLPPPLVREPSQPTMPVQSCRLFVASGERPRILSLYIDDWKAVAHAPALLANSVNASPDVVFGLARFTSEANLKTPRGAVMSWDCEKYLVSHFLGESSC